MVFTEGEKLCHRVDGYLDDALVISPNLSFSESQGWLLVFVSSVIVAHLQRPVLNIQTIKLLKGKLHRASVHII